MSRYVPTLYHPVHKRKTPSFALIGTFLLVMAGGLALSLFPHKQAEEVRPYIIDQALTKPAPLQKSQPPIAPAPFNASERLVRINQLDPLQYASAHEFDTWAYSACSAASTVEVMNSYGGRPRTIHDVLVVEAGIGEISPELGLLRPEGIGNTAAHFGFATTWMDHPSLDELIRMANSGHPVIVNFPPQKWEGGHLLVVRGGNTTHVHLADSSRLNMQWMERKTFLKYWAGWGIVLSPR